MSKKWKGQDIYDKWYKEYELTPANTVEFAPEDQYHQIQEKLDDTNDDEIVKPRKKIKNDTDISNILPDNAPKNRKKKEF